MFGVSVSTSCKHVAGNDHAVAAFAQAADHGNQVAAGYGVRAA